jgi:hypothetical protein
MSSTLNPTLPEPRSDQPYIEVSALEAGVFNLPLHDYVQGSSTSEFNVCLSLAFFLHHSVLGKHIVSTSD